MANTSTIAKLTQYVNNQVEHLGMFERNMRFADLLVRPTEWKGNVFSYDVYSFASYSMGTVGDDGAVSKKGLTVTRTTKPLSQDRGDSLGLDVREKNEGQIAEGLAGVYNFYQMKVEVPTIEKYVAGVFASDTAIPKVYNGTSALTTSNILSKINALFIALRNKRINPKECILYISTTNKALLDEVAFGKGILTLGSWNGDASAEVEIYKGAKVVEIDDTTMGTVDFALVHPYAFSVIDILGIVDVYDKVPGQPGWAQIDVRDYFDAWVEPNATDGIVVALHTAQPSA